ncbi:MAG: hypothetical protein ACYSWQ_06510 [Planctomycetota bacterium]
MVDAHGSRPRGQWPCSPHNLFRQGSFHSPEVLSGLAVVGIESQALYLEQLDFGKRAVRADAEVEDLGRSVAVEIFEPLGGPERNNRIPAYARMTDPVFAAETDYPQSA